MEFDPVAYARPIVPRELIRYTCGFDDYAAYLLSGMEVATMFNLALKKNFDRVVADFNVALDFGCGAGRISRLMQPQQLYGCDINVALTEYCSSSIPRGTYYQNGLMPPLTYDDGTFDLVCSFSVFSHLPQDVEDEWLAELTRVGAPGCVYLLTVQGDWIVDNLGDETADVRAAGFAFKKVHLRHGIALDFADYYEASYHTSDWIRENWSRHLEVVDILTGDDPRRYLSGDLEFAPFGNVPAFRAMGQDLVVAVKR